MKLDKILVAFDFSPASRKALDQAKALARGREIRVRIVHRLSPSLAAVRPLVTAHESWVEIGQFLDTHNGQERDKTTDELDWIVESAGNDVLVEHVIAEGVTAVEAIEEQVRSWEPDLVVVGSHGARGIGQLLLGSVASELLHRLDVAVMLVREESRLFEAGSVGPIVAPVDFSDHSQRALGFARGLVDLYDGSLHLLHAVELAHTPFKKGGLTSRLDSEAGLREKYVAALEGMLGGSKGEVSVEDGSAAGTILWARERQDAQLVVMGSRGLTGLPHLLVGSVAEKVARFCEVPVIIVR